MKVPNNMKYPNMFHYRSIFSKYLSASHETTIPRDIFPKGERYIGATAGELYTESILQPKDQVLKPHSLRCYIQGGL